MSGCTACLPASVCSRQWCTSLQNVGEAPAALHTLLKMCMLEWFIMCTGLHIYHRYMSLILLACKSPPPSTKRKKIRIKGIRISSKPKIHILWQCMLKIIQCQCKLLMIRRQMVNTPTLHTDTLNYWTCMYDIPGHDGVYMMLQIHSVSKHTTLHINKLFRF